MRNIRQALENIAPEESSERPVIDVLEIQDADILGFYDELQEQYPEVVNEYPAGEELLAWSQVWDIRLATAEGSNDPIEHPIDHFDGDLRDPTSDYNLFQAYLEAGGSIYLSGSHSRYAGRFRNGELFNFINYMVYGSPVLDVENVGNTSGGGHYPLRIPSDPEDFDRNFNDLTRILEDGSDALEFWYVGHYTDSIDRAYPLLNIVSGGPTMYAWLAEDMEQTDAGRLALSLDKSWMDGQLSSGAELLIQNIYTLLSGYRHYDLIKEFETEEIDLHGQDYFTITVDSHEEFFDLENIVVTDTMPACLAFISSEPAPDERTTDSDGRDVLVWDMETIPAGESREVRVRYEAVSTECE
ncbi:hypothetical protein [Chitinivibrio alkaliphilus]|nr:hypothetical protein [Chitinivibrio alkaliphilus]